MLACACSRNRYAGLRKVVHKLGEDRIGVLGRQGRDPYTQIGKVGLFRGSGGELRCGLGRSVSRGPGC